jgi:hypothetical protein
LTPLNSSRLLVPHVILVSFPSSSLLANRGLALDKATQCPTCVGPTSAPSNVEPCAPELPCVGAIRRSYHTLESSHVGATSCLSCRACTYLLSVLHLAGAALHGSCPCPSWRWIHPCIRLLAPMPCSLAHAHAVDAAGRLMSLVGGGWLGERLGSTSSTVSIWQG